MAYVPHTLFMTSTPWAFELISEESILCPKLNAGASKMVTPCSYSQGFAVRWKRPWSQCAFGSLTEECLCTQRQDMNPSDKKSRHLCCSWSWDDQRPQEEGPHGNDHCREWRGSERPTEKWEWDTPGQVHILKLEEESCKKFNQRGEQEEDLKEPSVLCEGAWISSLVVKEHCSDKGDPL